MKPLMYIIMFIVSMSSVLAVDTTQVTDTSGTEASVDVAFDSSGSSHLVYERSGSVYYRYADGDEVTVGSGNKPVVCVDDTDVVHVAYMNGSVVYYASKDDAWSTPVNIVAGKEVDIACDDIVHMAYTNTDSKQDILYLSIDDSVVSTPVLIKDGYYSSDSWGKTGRYYYSPRITSDGSNYYIAYKHHALDASMRWSDYYTYIQVYSSVDASTKTSPGLYKAHYAALSKNALSYDGGPVVFYNHGSKLYKGTGAWVQTLVDTASAPAVANEQYAFVKDGEISFFDGSDLIAIAQGSDPAVGDSVVYFTFNGDIYRTGAGEEENPCVDADGDGYYAYDAESCASGNDCNDDNSDSWRVGSYFVDYDGDGYHLTGLSNMDAQSRIAICYGQSVPYPYVSGSLGADCDDDNSSLTLDCSGAVVPGDDDTGGQVPAVPEFGLTTLGLLIAGLFIFVLRKRQ